MTVIERAARALARARNEDPDELTEMSDGTSIPRWHYDALHVRVVLNAILEPSEAMIRAGSEACGGDTSCLDGYEAMIEALLQE